MIGPAGLAGDKGSPGESGPAVRISTDNHDYLSYRPIHKNKNGPFPSNAMSYMEEEIS